MIAAWTRRNRPEPPSLLPSVPRLEPPPVAPEPNCVVTTPELIERAARDVAETPAEPRRYVVVITDSNARPQLSHTTLMHYREAISERDEWRRRCYQAEVREVR